MLARAVFASFIVLSVPVQAQQAQTPAITYQLTLDAKHVSEIAEALGALPFNRVAPLIQIIGRQIEEQNKAREPKTEAPK